MGSSACECVISAADSREAPVPRYCQVRRLNPTTKSKWESRLMTGIECCRLRAAIQTSFDGIGLPTAFSSSRIAA